mmetsp:Transcript_13056/g.55661  ORF Transcript_13056/g.55661 Transcript_13056/m.55661 type:complete len:245 (-) Transcript_13056:1297-2031(-)
MRVEATREGWHLRGQRAARAHHRARRAREQVRLRREVHLRRDLHARRRRRGGRRSRRRSRRSRRAQASPDRGDAHDVHGERERRDRRRGPDRLHAQEARVPAGRIRRDAPLRDARVAHAQLRARGRRVRGFLRRREPIVQRRVARRYAGRVRPGVANLRKRQTPVPHPHQLVPAGKRRRGRVGVLSNRRLARRVLPPNRRHRVEDLLPRGPAHGKGGAALSLPRARGQGLHGVPGHHRVGRHAR